MYDIAIIGGGPAGAAAAITAARASGRVLLLEKGRYPRHKVCGEFISAESLHLLASLLPNPKLLDPAPRIAQARIFAEGRCVHVAVNPAGASVPRFFLDEALWQAAEQAGIDCRQQTTVARAEQDGERFLLSCDGRCLAARMVIDASGRWSNFGEASPGAGVSPGSSPRFLGLKAHFRETAPILSSDLYFFEGGYCGVQPAGDDVVNVCALVLPDVAKSLSEVFERNRDLAARSRAWMLLFDEVRTFPAVHARPQPVRNGVLCAGDAAGFIDPFLGDGISLALRTGEAAGLIALESLNSRVAAIRYAQEYATRFAPLFMKAARLRWLLTAPTPLRLAAMGLLRAPMIANFLARATR